MNVHTLDDRIPITEVIRYSLNHYTHTSQGGIGHLLIIGKGIFSYSASDLYL